MAKMFILRGLPASGKSTWSEQFVLDNPNTIRVNRDEIRMELFGTWYPSRDSQGTVGQKEAMVTEVQQKRNREALSNGINVINDNTNLNPRFWHETVSLVKEAGAEFELVDFHIDIEEAITRNQNRERKVPEDIIRRMAREYISPNGEFHLFPSTYPVKEFRKPDSYREAIIFDMDGTLTDVSSIRHYVAKTEKKKYADFDMFHRSALFCPPNHDVLEFAQQAEQEGFAIIIVTARNERYRDSTQAWLDKHNVTYDNIFMRPDGDFRKDYVVKSEILEEIEKHYDVVHAVDDNPQVLQLWEEVMIPVTKVPSYPHGGIEKGTLATPFNTNSCLRCGKPMTHSTGVGPKCRRKV